MPIPPHANHITSHTTLPTVAETTAPAALQETDLPDHVTASELRYGSSPELFRTQLREMLESSDPTTRQAVELINDEDEQGFRILDVFDFRKSGGILERWFRHINVETFDRYLREDYDKRSRVTKKSPTAVWIRRSEGSTSKSTRRKTRYRKHKRPSRTNSTRLPDVPPGISPTSKSTAQIDPGIPADDRLVPTLQLLTEQVASLTAEKAFLTTELSNARERISLLETLLGFVPWRGFNWPDSQTTASSEGPSQGGTLSAQGEPSHFTNTSHEPDHAAQTIGTSTYPLPPVDFGAPSSTAPPTSPLPNGYAQRFNSPPNPAAPQRSHLAPPVTSPPTPPPQGGGANSNWWPRM